MRLRGLVFLLLFDFLLAAVAANPGPEASRIMPVDEAVRDSSLFAFRADLLHSVERKDKKALLEALDSNVLGSFGGHVGVDDFKELWKLDEPDSRIWSVLRDVLALGGAFVNDDEFWAPYVFAKWPNALAGHDEGLFAGVLIARDVPIYSERGLKSLVLTRRSYEIVVILERIYESTWYTIRTHDGIEGFAETKHIRLATEWRACFRKTARGWRLTALVAGD